MARKKVGEEARCVLTLPLYPEPYQLDVMEKRFRIFEELKRSLFYVELRKLKNLERTRAYRELQQQIRDEYKKQDSQSAKKLKALNARRNEMLKEAGLYQYRFQEDIKPMRAHFETHVYKSAFLRKAPMGL